MTQELYKRYRPKSFKQIVGQPQAIKILTDFIKRKAVPHTILFTGPSGCGKTTLARILAKKLGCDDVDFEELNAAKERGINMIRSVSERIGLSPRIGKCKIWVFDEAHSLTPDAQTSLLKMLEDTPSHVYFFLATTDPQKLKATIKTRSSHIKCETIKSKDMEGLLVSVCRKEKVEISEEVIERIIEVADGSARMALVILDQIIGLEDEDDQLSAIQSQDVKANAILIARILANPRATWSELSSTLAIIEDDPEQLRYMILGYFSKVLLNSKSAKQKAYANRAAKIIDLFEDNFYDGKRASLVKACFYALQKD